MEQIFVKDFVHETEIGVYQSEFGKKQRLKFNVFLTIDYLNKNRNDNIEDVISYEIIINAIKKHTSASRLYLLETLASKISETCFEDQRVKKIDIKIEKLDRIKGSLGIRMVTENKLKWSKIIT